MRSSRSLEVSSRRRSRATTSRCGPDRIFRTDTPATTSLFSGQPAALALVGRRPGEQRTGSRAAVRDLELDCALREAESTLTDASTFEAESALAGEPVFDGESALAGEPAFEGESALAGEPAFEGESA